MKKAIVLGGTSPHVLLIEKLKKRGYETVLVDYLSNSPGIAAADRHIQESTLDKEKIVEIAAAEKADLVISTCIDQANSTCCYVAEKLGLPKPYDYKTSLDVTDKGLMKKIMVDNDIPTSPYQVVEKEEEIDWNKVTYPAVVKPVDCNSSKGVHRADSRDEVLKYVNEAIGFSRTGNAIIEGFNCGEEIQVDCFSEESEVKVLMTRQKKKIAARDGMVLQSTGSVIPAPLSDDLNRQAAEIAEKIASAFGLKNTPFFYQAIVTENGISVLEFAPRIGGGLSYYLIKTIAGVDIVECAIDSFVGTPVKTEVKKDGKYYSTNLLYMNPGIYDHIEGFEELKNAGIIKDSFEMKKKGTEIDSDLRSGNRVGAFVVEADSFEQLSVLEKKAYSVIKVIGSCGNDLLNRSVIS